MLWKICAKLKLSWTDGKQRMRREYDITPIPKPRMTQKDKWQKRPATDRYWAFKNECLAKNVQVYTGDRITFVLPFPKGWGKAKRETCDGSRHTVTPDIDNLLKALLDAVLEDDAHISSLYIEKVWGKEGKIIIHG